MPITNRIDSFAFVVVWSLFCQGTPKVNAELYKIENSEQFRQRVAGLKAGDKIELAPGEYRGGFHIRGLHGTETAPIVIAGADKNNPPKFIHETAACQLSACSHLEIRNIEITKTASNGLNVDDGGNRDQPAHHIRLIEISISDVGPKGNIDGIKLSGVDDFQIERCSITRWGSSGSGIDMVGCHRGVIQDCTFTEGGSNSVQTKGGTSDVLVRRCQFKEFGLRGVNIGGSTGDDYFRPALDRFPNNERYEAKNITVEGCTFVGGMAPIVFVGVDGAMVRYNTIYRPKHFPIRILREKNDPGFIPTRNGKFEHNIVIASPNHWPNNLINVGGGTAPETFSFAKNLWYCDQTSDRREPRFPINQTDSLIGIDPQFIDTENGDFGVRQDSPASDRGAQAYKRSDAK